MAAVPRTFQPTILSGSDQPIIERTKEKMHWALLEHDYYSRLIEMVAERLCIAYPQTLCIPPGFGVVRGYVPLEWMQKPRLEDRVCTGLCGALPGLKKGGNDVNVFLIEDCINRAILMQKGCFGELEFVTIGENATTIERRVQSVTEEGKIRKTYTYARANPNAYVDSPYNTDESWLQYRKITYVVIEKNPLIDELVEEGHYIWVPFSGLQRMVLRTQHAEKRRREFFCFMGKTVLTMKKEMVDVDNIDSGKYLEFLAKKAPFSERGLEVRLHIEHEYYRALTLMFAEMLGLPFKEVLNWDRGKRQIKALASIDDYFRISWDKRVCPIWVGSWRADPGEPVGPREMQVRFLIDDSEGVPNVLLEEDQSESRLIEIGELSSAASNRKNKQMRIKVIKRLSSTLIFHCSQFDPLESLVDTEKNRIDRWFRYKRIWFSRGDKASIESALVKRKTYRWVPVTREIAMHIPYRQRGLILNLLFSATYGSVEDIKTLQRIALARQSAEESAKQKQVQSQHPQEESLSLPDRPGLT